MVNTNAMESRNAKGWNVVIGCSTAIFWSGALIFGYPGVMGEYWRTTFGSGTALVMTFVLISLGIGMFLCGKWHMKSGTRLSILRGTAIQIVGMLFAIFASNIYMVWVWAFLTGFSSCFIYGPGLATVQNWFPNKRGLVTGIVNLVFGSSAAIMAPIMNWMLGSMGSFQMNIILLVLILIVNVIAALKSEMPDRASMTEEERNAHQELLESLKSGGSSPGKALTTSEALHTRNFWLLWLVWAFMGAAGISMVSLSKSYSVFLGIASVSALTAFNATNGVSRIIAGFLSDKMGRKTLGMLSFILGGIGYALLPFIQTEGLLCLFAAFVGYAFGTLFTITGPLVTDLFGLKYFGMIFGLIFTAYGFIGGIVGPLLASAVFDMTGSYLPVFAYLAVFCFLAAGLIMCVKTK